MKEGLQVADRRFTLIDSADDDDSSEFAREVAAGLAASPKRLSCRYLYDEEGSRLFEEICALPEYYLTRAEAEILAARADEIAGRFPPGTWLVELGSGSARKTRILIEALLRRRRGLPSITREARGVPAFPTPEGRGVPAFPTPEGRGVPTGVGARGVGARGVGATGVGATGVGAREAGLRYLPVDISRSMLKESAWSLLREYPSLAVTAIAAEYRDGLRLLRRLAASDRARLILWLGSNVGNFDRADAARFLGEVRATMGGRDRMLVGVDLRKERATLERAYDDASGVTARFNLNLLDRINRELGGGFDRDGFQHRAIYDERLGRVEMYLVSRRAQRVPIEALALEVEFAAGEAVHTESSYKYSLDEIESLAGGAGLSVADRWFDGERRFCLNLLAPL